MQTERDNSGENASPQLSLFLSPIVGTNDVRKERAIRQNKRRAPIRQCRDCARRLPSWKDGVLCAHCIKKIKADRAKDEEREARLKAVNFNVFPEGF